MIKLKRSLSNRTFDIINGALLIIFSIIMLYPLIYVLSCSISDPLTVYTGQIVLFPKGITFKAYVRVFENEMIVTGYLNTLLYTFVGSLISIACIFTASYALSRRDMKGRSFFMGMFIVTMFFGGGLVPLYILMDSLSLTDSMWAVIMPTAVGCWNIILVRTYMSTSIPQELQESAKVDGANDFTIFFRIILPLSGPMIAIMSLFVIVGYWNNYFYAMIFLSSESKYPLQLVLRNILISQDMGGMGGGSQDSIFEQAILAETLKYASIVVSTLPILLIYPFLSKYFEKGLMVGSIKG